MSKKVIFNEKAKTALKAGIDRVAEAVRITLGPRGRNVALDKGYGAPMITNDGVSIAKEISLKDPVENMGASIIKEVAEKTNEIAGDGTSTSALLMQSMITKGLKHMAMGANGVLVRSGIERATKDAIEALQDISKPIKGKESIKQVATIAAESEEWGSIIADTIEKVGKDGAVTVEESQSIGVSSEVVEGLSFDNGYISPYMVTNPDRMEAELKDPAILVTDQKISSIQKVLPLLEKLTQTGQKDLVVIADDVEGEALATFVVNKLRGTLNVLAVKAPGFGDRKKENLEDIAIVVGATVVTDEKGMKMEEVEPTVLGRAGRVVSKKDSTVIVSGAGTKKAIDSRVFQLKTILADTKSKFDKEKLEERIAKLSGGVAVIRAGAATETEMKYIKLKIEDAVNATRAAIEEGIVPGGGSALAMVAEKLEKKFSELSKKENPEFKTGYRIIIDSLTEPLKQIAENSGKEDGSVKVYEVQKKGGSAGYDALLDKIVPNMFEAGIIDPLKVTRTALQNASSAAAIFLTTDVVVAEEPEEKHPPHGGPGMDGMGMM